MIIRKTYNLLLIGVCSTLLLSSQGYLLAGPMEDEIDDFGQALVQHLADIQITRTSGFHLPDQGVTILMHLAPRSGVGWWGQFREGSVDRYQALEKRVQSLKGRRESNPLALQAQLLALRAQLDVFRSLRGLPWAGSVTAFRRPEPTPEGVVPPPPPPPPPPPALPPSLPPPPPPPSPDEQRFFPQWTEEDWNRFDAEVEKLEKEIAGALDGASADQIDGEDFERQVVDRLIEGIAREGTRLRSLAPEEYVNIVWLEWMGWHGTWGSLQHGDSKPRTFSVQMSDILAFARGEVDLETFKGRVRRTQDGPR